MTCFSTARSVTTSAAAIAAFERPSAIRPSTSRSRAVRRLERVLAPAAAEQQRDDLGVERRAAARHAPDSVGERVHVRHAILEQVAGALGGLREQLERVGLLDVLREHEHRRARVLGADPVGGAQALVGVGRRHPDVDHRDVGMVGSDLAQQILGVAGLAGHFEAGFLEQARQTLAQQHGVVGDHDTDFGVTHTGISARSLVPAPAGESSCMLPSSADDAVGEAAQARSAARIGAADAVVGDLDDRRGRCAG